MNTIIWILRTGSPWCALPLKYGSGHTVYNNFRKWSQEGVMEKIFKKFALNPEKITEIQIDAIYIKAHQHSARAKKGAKGEAIGKSKGGLTSKIHVVADGSSKVIRILITDGSVHESTQAKNLIDCVIHKGVYVLGDRVFDSYKILNYIAEKSVVSVIPHQ